MTNGTRQHGSSPDGSGARNRITRMHWAVFFIVFAAIGMQNQNVSAVDRHFVWLGHNLNESGPPSTEPLKPVPATDQTRTDPVYIEVLKPESQDTSERALTDRSRLTAPGTVINRGMLPVPVFDAAASFGHDRLVTTGGFDGDLETTNVIQIHHAKRGWQPVSTALAQARAQHRQVALADGRVLLVGGVTGSLNHNGKDPDLTALDTAEVFHPLRIGTTTIQMANPMIDLTMTGLPDGRIAIVGGGLARVFDPQCDSFTDAIRLHRARAGHAVALQSPVDEDEMPTLLIIGGDEDGTIEQVNFDRRTSRLWIHRLPRAVHGASAVYVGSGETLVICGENLPADFSTIGGSPGVARAWLLGAADMIRPIEIAGLNRAVNRSAWFDGQSRRVYLLGGEVRLHDRITGVDFNTVLTWPARAIYRAPETASDETVPIRQAWVATGSSEFTAVGGYRFVSPEQAAATGRAPGVDVLGEVVTISVRSMLAGD